jgi:hypothetical protein
VYLLRGKVRRIKAYLHCPEGIKTIWGPRLGPRWRTPEQERWAVERFRDHLVGGHPPRQFALPNDEPTTVPALSRSQPATLAHAAALEARVAALETRLATLERKMT